jgi:hypothetical protein
MKHNFGSIILVMILFICFTAGCAGQTLYEENVQVEAMPIPPTVEPPTVEPTTVDTGDSAVETETATAAPTPQPEEEPLGPAETVDAFYQEYVAYAGDDFLRTENNPLVDGVYQDSPYLSPRFIQELADYTAAYNPHGYDPVVMAVQIPSEWTVGEAVVEGDKAVVEIRRAWSTLDTWLPMQVLLKQENGRWLIDDVSVVNAAYFTPDGNTPEEVVEAFYTWYLAYTGSPAAGEFRSPLSERAYAESPSLSADLMAAMDTTLAQMHEREMGGADPFLCAQNIPVSVFVPDAFVVGDDEARVLLRTGFFGPHYLVLTLRPADGGWLIDEIECASQSPAGIARAFYTWYLGYIGAREGGEFRNPLVDGVYRDTPFLSDDFVQRVDAMLADKAQGGFDPFLLAQDIPHGFSVLPGPGAEEALVTFYFLDEKGEPYNEWQALVSFVGENGRYQINAVDSQNAPAVTPFHSDAYGFSFHYPADWVLAEQELAGPGMPDDWPVLASWQVMPAAVAEQIAAQSGPPDPQAPPVVASFQVDVVVGDETAVSRAFLPLEEAEIGSVGRNLAYVLSLEPGYSHQIFPHPYRPDTWIVITDWVTEFPGRESQGEISLPVLAQLQNSLQFQQ